MFLFGKSRKKREQERLRQEELAKQAKIEEDKKRKTEQDKEKLAAFQQKNLEEALHQNAEPQKAAVKKAPVKKTPKKEETIKKAPSGKYEIYPEAGLFKFRLKASNGEILAVSFGYSTKKGAKTGIETFKNAVLEGNFEISTDKAGFTHYDLFGSRGARVIMIGEFYKTLKLAESAVESVKKFYQTEKVIELESIPSIEVREEIAAIPKTAANPNGKFQLVREEKLYYIKLLASNAQVLLVSQGYSTKQSALNGLEAIKNAIISQNFTTSRDKQNRYQYNLYTSNKQLIVSGETYPSKQSCLSAIQSVVRFAIKAELQEVK